MKLHAGTREAVVLVFLGLALLFVITNSSANAYRSERLRLAESHYKSGEDLAKAGQPAKARAVLSQALSGTAAFASRQAAEQLLASLKRS